MLGSSSKENIIMTEKIGSNELQKLGDDAQWKFGFMESKMNVVN